MQYPQNLTVCICTMPYGIKKTMRFFIVAMVFFLSTSSTNGQQLSTGELVSEFVSESIEQNEIVVFSKSHCPYCKATKSTLKEYTGGVSDIDVKIVELDLMDGEDGSLVQNELFEISGQRTAPNIFINGGHIGGNSDLEVLSSYGDLDAIIRGLSAEL